VLRIDLLKLDAVRFKAVLGGDYPLGDETQRRKTYAVQVKGTEARFLTIIEPYEETGVIRGAEATNQDSLRVELLDGRVQEIVLKNMTGTGRDIAVEITETKDGRVSRAETTGVPASVAASSSTTRAANR